MQSSGYASSVLSPSACCAEDETDTGLGVHDMWLNSVLAEIVSVIWKSEHPYPVVPFTSSETVVRWNLVVCFRLYFSIRWAYLTFWGVTCVLFQNTAIYCDVLHHAEIVFPPCRAEESRRKPKRADESRRKPKWAEPKKGRNVYTLLLRNGWLHTLRD
jgi:hypothetical protein